MNTADIKRFFTDLYRDLDDRHLALPALMLVVAIIAVPILLGGSSAEPVAPAASPTPVVDSDATEVEAAVLAGDPGIRDYSERLEALKEKNPFVQQFASADPAAPTDAAAALSAGSPSAESAELASPTTGGETAAATDTPVVDPTSGGETVPSEPTQTVPEQGVRFFAPRVDVLFGKLGETEEIDSVRYFDFLPNEKTPVAAFLGLGESADKAVFAVSNEVVETSGEGSCSPHNADGCDLLILRVGQERTLKLVDGTTYRLKVLDTHFSRIPDPRDGDESTDAGGAEGAKPIVTSRP